MPVTLSSPLSLYSIPVVWFIAFVNAPLRTSYITKVAGRFNNADPRGNVKRLLEKNPEAGARAARMEAANANGNEILPLWAAAVLAGNYAGLENKTLNVCSAAFIALRALYNYIYVNQKTHSQGNLRTITWFAGVFIPLGLLIKAANKVLAGDL
ncbi:hypothetical protein GLOTRDRAFT_141378 [Gloeophyllum trabeum ATCC 11539]|uniref:Membrane-associated proteins in eicosanoid and glutathione metabolism n=1 Tax=Gloeophyllum trabeum (strain ATCC 11539 / FP-39264 / Madison 617) TaxID=670483 RepID=S7R9H4_GLOTA|nr:uncharacterized protein GLOTRDRAFT_141378 [Gloeophyllum trabeum ATCC 11539]EPQ50925.1 hypothetical protein GLOTRDRAFT_141378 [Gloeophyllum trabeum ATCC 11539]